MKKLDMKFKECIHRLLFTNEIFQGFYSFLKASKNHQINAFIIMTNPIKVQNWLIVVDRMMMEPPKNY